jgi:hypothetical protein
MAGGKGGSTTSSVQIPEYIEKAAQRNLNKAERISQLGYVPYYGPDVAAFTPMQQAAFQNTADAASAFGMAAPTLQQDIMGGMPAPMQYAGGIQGYSSAPLYQQSLDQLALKRPAQKSYIDSFFIDPYTGEYGSNVQAPIDYNQYSTMADQARADRANAFAIAQLENQPTFTYDGKEYPTSSQASGFISDPASPLITDTSNAGFGTQLYNDVTEAAIGATLGLFDPTYKVGGVNNPIETPTVAEMTSVAPSGMTYNPSTGGYERTGSSSSAPATVGADAGDGMVWAKSENSNALVRVPAPKETTSTQSSSSAPKTSPKPVLRPSDSGGDSGGGGGDSGGCVVATHAVNSGAFTPSMKREAVVWCMNVLHDKWWGEAIRRGYRYLGRKKIEQGKAHEHYQEFRDYIAFASGKKRTIKGAIHFAARTAQFFAVGLIKGDA